MGAPIQGQSEVKQCKRSDSRVTWEKRRVVKLSTYILCPKIELYAKSRMLYIRGTRLANLRNLLQICNESFHFFRTRGFIWRTQYGRRVDGGHHLRSKIGFHKLTAMLRDAKIPVQQCLRRSSTQTNNYSWT